MFIIVLDDFFYLFLLSESKVSRTAERAKRHDDDHDDDDGDDEDDNDGDDDHDHGDNDGDDGDDHDDDDGDHDHDHDGDCNQKSAGLPKEQRGIMTTAIMSIHRHLLMST